MKRSHLVSWTLFACALAPAAFVACRGSVERTYDDELTDSGALDATPAKDAGDSGTPIDARADTTVSVDATTDAGEDATTDAPTDAEQDADAGGPVCGNGAVEPGEACDDGDDTACGNCNATCTGAGTGQPITGCACGPVVTVANPQPFGPKMTGCPGAVAWTAAATLCHEGCSPCTSAQWVALHGATAPLHHYWTADDLHYTGSGALACAVTLDGGSPCAPTPMRVCKTTSADAASGTTTDPEANVCNWWSCGYETITPNQFFGGCSGNATAGALCCCP